MLAAVTIHPPRRPFPCFTAILDRGCRARVLPLPCLRLRLAIFGNRQNDLLCLGCRRRCFLFNPSKKDIGCARTPLGLRVGRAIA